MDWQNTFFVLGSLFLLGWLVFLTLLIVFISIVYKKTRELQSKISEKMDHSAIPFMPVLIPLIPLLLPLVKRFVFRSRR